MLGIRRRPAVAREEERPPPRQRGAHRGHDRAEGLHPRDGPRGGRGQVGRNRRGRGREGSRVLADAYVFLFLGGERE